MSAQQAENEGGARPTRSSPIRVLIIDDDWDTLEMLSLTLRKRGMDVMTAKDGLKGIEESRRARFDVAIVDLGLPHLHGHRLGETLRTNGDRPRLIALTGDGRAEARAESERIGFDAHFVKPAPMTELIDLIERLAD